MPVKLSNVWIVVCGLGIVVPAYFAQQNPPSKGREVTKLYADTCASCHGANMSGGSASSLADHRWRYGGDVASIARSLREGHTVAGMVAREGSLTFLSIPTIHTGVMTGSIFPTVTKVRTDWG